MLMPCSSDKVLTKNLQSNLPSDPRMLSSNNIPLVILRPGENFPKFYQVTISLINYVSALVCSSRPTLIEP